MDYKKFLIFLAIVCLLLSIAIPIGIIYGFEGNLKLYFDD